MDGLSSVAVGDAAAVQVVRGELDLDFVAREDADVVLAHLAGDRRENAVAALELDPEHRAGQRLYDLALDLDFLFLERHSPHTEPRSARAIVEHERHSTARLRRE